MSFKTTSPQPQAVERLNKEVGKTKPSKIVELESRKTKNSIKTYFTPEKS